MKTKIILLLLLFSIVCLSFGISQSNNILINTIDKKCNIIDKTEACKICAAHYNKLFEDKYWLNPINNKYYKFLQIDENSFTTIIYKNECWNLKVDPPAGPYIIAIVSPDGKFVQFQDVGFSLE